MNNFCYEPGLPGQKQIISSILESQHPFEDINYPNSADSIKFLSIIDLSDGIRLRIRSEAKLTVQFYTGVAWDTPLIGLRLASHRIHPMNPVNRHLAHWIQAYSMSSMSWINSAAGAAAAAGRSVFTRTREKYPSLEQTSVNRSPLLN